MHRCAVIALIVFLMICSVLCWFLFVPRTPRAPDWFVKYDIADPMPSSLKLVKTLYNFHPTLGDGECDAAYTVSADDFEVILKAKKWQNMEADPKNEGLGQKEMFQQFETVWPGVEPELILYKSGDEYPSVQMLVSKDHTRILFNIWQ